MQNQAISLADWNDAFVHGVNAREIADSGWASGAGFPPPESPQTKTHIKLVPFADIQLTDDCRYLVKGLVPLPGLTVVWGPPKCGKSFFVQDLLMRVALNRDYRGRRVRGGAVVHCAFEGATGLRARVEAFRQRQMGEADSIREIPFFLVPTTLDLVREYTGLIDAIRATLGDQQPVAVCLDTLNRSLNGSENKDEDMSAYVRACDAIREAFDCAVIVVHHCGIEGSRPRGHTSLTGAADCQIAVSRDRSDNIVVIVEWMKDGPEGETVTSRLEQLDVGTDEDGEPITSCIVVEADLQPQAVERRTKLTPNQQTMLSLLEDAEPHGLTTEEWNAKARAVDIGVKRAATLYDLRATLERKKFVYQGMDRWHRMHAE